MGPWAAVCASALRSVGAAGLPLVCYAVLRPWRCCWLSQQLAQQAQARYRTLAVAGVVVGKEGRRGEGGGWRPCQLHVSERCCAVRACQHQQQSRGQYVDAIVAAVVPCLTVFVSSLHLPALVCLLSVTRVYVHTTTTQVCFDQLKGFRGC